MSACADHCQSAGASHVGLVRKLNEDSFLDRPDLGLWVVADGMGGHDSGDVASQSLCAALSSLPDHLSLADAVDYVDDACTSVNAQLVQLAQQRGSSIIGTTVVAFVLRGNTAVCLWAGDSRLYRLRGSSLAQLSEDHSFFSQPEQERHPEVAASHGHIITRAVGAGDELCLDVESILPMQGDRYLLCSDGLSNELSDERLGAELALGSAEQCTGRLIANALESGGQDNVTALVVDVTERGHR